jgi:uncharacterized OsmC-like protein
MSDTPVKMRFHVESRRIDAHRSGSTCKLASITLDTDMGGNPHAFNPAELLLAAVGLHDQGHRARSTHPQV